jgi:hypothetical protein
MRASHKTVCVKVDIRGLPSGRPDCPHSSREFLHCHSLKADMAAMTLQVAVAPWRTSLGAMIFEGAFSIAH